VEVVSSSTAARGGLRRAKEKGGTGMSKAKLGTGTRFKNLTEELKKKGVENPEALAAAIGRKKYGEQKMEEPAREGRNQ
jgi:hypothetical protein